MLLFLNFTFLVMTSIPWSQVEILIVFFFFLLLQFLMCKTYSAELKFCWFYLLHISVFCLIPCTYSSTAFVQGGSSFFTWTVGIASWLFPFLSLPQSVYSSHCSQFSSLSLFLFQVKTLEQKLLPCWPLFLYSYSQNNFCFRL